MVNRFIVMTAAAKMPSKCKGRYGKIAVVETSGQMPKQMHPKHKSVKRIIEVWDRRHIGKTERSEFQKCLKEANDLCETLNSVSQYFPAQDNN